MKFFLVSIPAYLLFLVLSFGASGWVISKRQPLQLVDVFIYGGAILALVMAVMFLNLIIARVAFPTYWWLGQVVGKDVFEFEGIYFLGLRLSRVPTRIQRILFGVDDQMRKWDLVGGILFLALLAPHALGFLTVNHVLNKTLPNPTRFSLTLHYPILSSMPVMREWGVRWNINRGLTRRIGADLQAIETQGIEDNGKRFRLAQLYLLQSFVPRLQANDPFVISPGERVYFDRGMGAQAADLLRNMADLPATKRAGWSGSILSLLGFFYLADGNFKKAADFSNRAVLEFGDREESKISRYQILLLAALTALITGDPQRADGYLGVILDDDRMPRVAHALALEHRADLMRLQGKSSLAGSLLQQSLKIFHTIKDRSGEARIHLQLALIALDAGDRKRASEEISKASSLAEGQNDLFTLNMLEQLSLRFNG